MSRAPSPATQIRTLKRELAAAMKDVSEYRMLARIADGKATKAQQDAAEWKRRFDALLGADKPLKVVTAFIAPDSQQWQGATVCVTEDGRWWRWTGVEWVQDTGPVNAADRGNQR